MPRTPTSNISVIAKPRTADSATEEAIKSREEILKEATSGIKDYVAALRAGDFGALIDITSSIKLISELLEQCQPAQPTQSEQDLGSQIVDELQKAIIYVERNNAKLQEIDKNLPELASLDIKSTIALISQTLGVTITQPDMPGREVEGLVKEPKRKTLYSKLDALLESEGVIEDARPAKVVEIAHTISPQISDRIKWSNRFESYELSGLTAPRFIIALYADCIYKNHIYKETIRCYDPELMEAVETYISTRTRRNLDLGDAKKLAFVTSKAATNKVDRTPTRTKTPRKPAPQTRRPEF